MSSRILVEAFSFAKFISSNPGGKFTEPVLLNTTQQKTEYP